MFSLSAPIPTPYDPWPAGAKLAALLGASLALFALPGLTSQLLAFEGALALALFPGLRFAGAVLRPLRGLWPFGLLLLAWHGLTGTLAEGLAIALRITTMLTLAQIVTMTTPLSAMMALAAWLARPLSPLLPPARLALAFGLTLRFLPSLQARAEALRLAAAARSARPPRARLILPLALAALDEAELVADALRARGGVA